MKSFPRKKRMIENEVIFRTVNKGVQEFIEGEPEYSDNDKIKFYCECSKPDCLERINLTSKEYKEYHNDKKHFVILVGHEFPEIEKVIEKYSNYQIVEKNFTPPKSKDISLVLNSISESV